jgi:hypothetical protein
MRKHWGIFAICLAVLSAMFAAGCGQETVFVPSVVSTSPAQGAINVAINAPISATFSMAMKSASITSTTFTVTSPGGAVAGSVSYSGMVATFTPKAALAYGTVYTATITTGATNLGGIPLLTNHVWSFTTAAIIPVPTVVSVVPLDGTANVPVNQALSATFSVAMNPATINATTFTVKGPVGAAVSGVVAYTGKVATFTPSAHLANSTAYTATITTGTTSAAGASLAANYVWTFTTIAPPPVVVSTLPANKAQSVPISQALSATFSEAMNPATINSASFTVTGAKGVAIPGAVAYSGLKATFTPSAHLANSTAYTATITTGATSAAGVFLATNHVWTFTTIAPPPVVVSTLPANKAQSVPISQVLSATFSEAMNKATIDSSSFTVTGTNGVAIPGAVAYSGLKATFTPTAHLANSTAYTATITTGATSAAGVSLAANYVWTFTTIAPPPVVVSTLPANKAQSVPISQVLSATFSEAMNPATIDSSSFTVTGTNGVAIPGVVAYSGLKATFTPTALLDYSTLYTATITTQAEDLAGTALVSSHAWTFTTISPPLAVISTIPVNGATGVPVSQVLSATFNESMNCTTLKSPATAFTVTGPSSTPVAGTVSCSGDVATFTPGVALTVNTLYTATINTTAKDLANVALASKFAWSFLTVPAPTPPTVISTVPLNLATSVPVNQAIAATFSVAMDAASIDTTTFKLTGPGVTPVTGVVTYVAAGSIATLTPDTNLASNTVYTATITTGARDLEDTALAKNYVWSFTTAAGPTDVPPTVLATIPLNGAVDVSIKQVVSATFSKAMNPATISSTTFKLTGPDTTAVTGLVAYAAIGDTLTFTPAASLASSTLYTATITNGVTDLAGNAMVDNYVWTFTSAAAIDTTKPEIVLTAPVSAAIDVPLNQAVSATFTEAINPLTITTATFQLTGPSAAPIAGTVSYDAINMIATFTPTVPLTASTTYTATVTDGVTDLSGNPLGNTGKPNPWSFTTGAAAVTPPVVIGPTALLFGAFGGAAGITNQGVYTVINGDIGTTGVSTLVTGFHDTSVMVSGVPECVYTETPLNVGLVNGAIETAAPPPTVGCPDEGTAVTYAIAAEGALEALTAYNTLAAIPNGLDVSVCPGCGGGSAGELGNRTLASGVYKSAPGSFAISQGDLTLDAKGDPNAYWVFQMATTLTIGTPTSNRNVLLVNGAQAKNVFWQVGSAATINGILGGGTVEGTIIAQAGVSISTAGVVAITTLNGRALVLTGPVTLVNTVINVPAQ